MTSGTGRAVRAVMSMQDIADVARVRRPVVSMWRTRYTDGPFPFPDPVAPGDSRFDAEEVARWFRDTGRGNNPEAADDVALHTSLLHDTVRATDAASLLALLSARAGGPAADLDQGQAFEIAAGLADQHLASLDDVESALTDSQTVAAVDRLSEAAYGPVPVIRRLAELGCAADPAGEVELLTDEGLHIVNTVGAELIRSSPGLVAPAGPGGLVLLDGAVGLLDEHEATEFACAPSTRALAWQRARWRALLAGGASVRQVVAGDPVLADATVLAQWASAARTEAAEFFAWIDDIVVSLGPGGRAVVIGPAELLIDDLSGEERQRRAEVLGGADYFAPLRFAARLPKGLVRSAGRRQLAVWVVAPSGDEQKAATVIADHSALTGQVEVQALAADVAAAAAGERERRSHTFLRGTVRASRVVVPQHRLRVSVTDERVLDGGDLLAQVWEASSHTQAPVLEGIGMAAGADRGEDGASVPWQVATSGRGRPVQLIPGVRVPAESIGAAVSGSVTVLGECELRNPGTIGRRGVDRLALEQIAPNSTFTEPGDVVYLRTADPAAMVDDVGGRLVVTPARIARCRDVELAGRKLLPHIVAADIAEQRSANVDAWRLRTVPADQADVVAEARERIEARRGELRSELAALDQLERSLTRGITRGLLRAEFTSGTSDPEEQKENATWRSR
ncbi:DNA-binding protein [Gordonia iterans]|nr:DNA-binding protein [Gordonia iterans]